MTKGKEEKKEYDTQELQLYETDDSGGKERERAGSGNKKKYKKMLQMRKGKWNKIHNMYGITKQDKGMLLEDE